METRFTQFLRFGGNGEFQFKRDGKSWVATSLSIKSEFPNYQALRERFEAKLNEVIASNTAMLLQSVGLQFDPPLTAENLPSVNDARAEALALWEERIAVIWAEWHSHLQRLRPIRESMEANLLRGFAGLVNELRQRGLGVRQYIWRSRDDSKVRSAHAAHDDQVFSWDNPPEGGHPGQAFNCRCIAEPLPPGPYGNVVLAELTIPSDGITSPGAEVGRRLPGGLIARTAAGLALYLALEASRQLQGFTAAASQQRVLSAASIIGVDLETVEGLWAAITYAQAREAASTGLVSGVPKDGPGADVFAQGMALYAMANPEALRSIQGFNEAVERVGSVAVLAWQEGRLRARDGNLAFGWAEVFPELTDAEKRLGQLPGFTPGRIEAFREEYPTEVLGLPDNTGSAPDDAPVGNVISTPMPEDVGPNIVEARPGEPTPVNPNDDESTKRGIRRENESAGVLAENGCDVLQNPAVPGSKRPDYLINGEIYDHYAPETSNVRRIWERVKEKLEEGQASNFVISLQDSAVDEEALRRQFSDWPIEGLGEVLIVRPDGTIGEL